MTLTPPDRWATGGPGDSVEIVLVDDDAAPIVLLVEDDPNDGPLVRQCLEDGGFACVEVRDIARAARHLTEAGADAVVVDLRVAGGVGAETMTALRAINLRIPIVVLSDPAGEDIARAALLRGAQDYVLTHHLDTHLLSRIVRYAMEQKRTEYVLRHMALHDSLTGLANRTLFLDRLQRTLGSLDAGPGSVAVLLLGLDRFKLVNDSLGHDAGDELLVEVARRLQAILRPTDSAARFGGDEFLVLCEGLASEGQALAVARRLEAALAVPFRLHGAEVHVSASIGIATASSAGSSAVELVRDASAAMLRAKERGKAHFELFDGEMRGRAQARLALEIDLRRAIERQELEVHYQPIVAMGRGEVVAFEALVRWRRPDGAMVSPADFIPLAEETGLVTTIGGMVFHAAAHQAALWGDPQRRAEPVPLVSVNLSARQLLDPQLVPSVVRSLAEASVDPRLLTVEVTESAVMGDESRSLEALRQLKELGIRLCVDDFGTGYSSLSYLQRFPFDVIKIDRSFVRGITARQGNRAIVQAVVDLGRALGLSVVAEGIETYSERTELESMGCPLGQGFLFARPGPVESVGPLLGRKLPASLVA